ncbi:DUF4115 domain-containing protein [Tumebacillus sp. DT12]|uniref:DUF4115 domain-containing protein n=1 Tax=Tumebacillus lacus TaxID=2995335 RepID=A0ABT3WY35_9BACL|nr:RodZ domain-containing protein [Tumebacillus lacus]MCX7568598.1 DUF4115 domain-containing protein [Tumebacillus lacus]
MQEIGNELKRLREQKGCSLEEVQQATKIRSRYLEAIEEGDLSALPGMVYARGFIKSYAEYLGVNGQELLEQHGLAADVQSPPPEEMRSTRVKKEREASLTNARPSLLGSRAFPQIVAVVAVVAVLAIGYGVIVSNNQTEDTESKSQETAKTEAEGQPAAPLETAPAPAQTPAPAPAQQPAPEPPKPKTTVEQSAKTNNSTTYAVTTTGPMSMQLAATSDCWIQVTADGKIIETGTVKAGETRTWQANQNIAVLTGNSKGVTMKINDQNVAFEPQLRGYTYAFHIKP